MIHNFNAGPSILPRVVFEKASQAILNFNNSGLSILEIGHRTPLFEEVMDTAIKSVKQLMRLDDDHEVLFLHGGATTQFMQIPYNLLEDGATAAYTETGTWSNKAIKEAQLFGNVVIAGSSKNRNYTYMPVVTGVPADAAYLHITTNETIAGTQWQHVPWQEQVPVVADMSSDIFSRNLDFNRFGLIYAGAQKNMGAAGVNLVIVNKQLLGKVSRKIPSILDYNNHIKEKSMLNTPPVFAVYVAMLTLQWLIQQGGIGAIEKVNDKKAGLVYEAIDNNPIYNAVVEKASRSKMNVVFTMDDAALEQKFLQQCKENNFYGVKGHRSVGGFRISLYNALPVESVEAVTQFMNNFAKENA